MLETHASVPPSTSMDSIPERFTSDFQRSEHLSLEEGLRELPFHPSSDIDHGRAPSEYIDADFPVDRIVAAPRIDSWASDGSAKVREDGTIVPSLQYATQIAATRGYMTAPKPITIDLFVDNDGHLWGAVADGVHRAIAAKINREPHVPAKVRRSIDPKLIDRYDGSILQEHADIKARARVLPVQTQERRRGGRHRRPIMIKRLGAKVLSRSS